MPNPEQLDLCLHFAPDTCARVTIMALEKVLEASGQPYRTELVAFMRGDHKQPSFLTNNPKGKVPLLLIDGRPLTENPAILWWLATRFSEAELLPITTDSLANAEVMADLSWCASGLHPIVTRLRIPQFFCDTNDGVARVFAMAEIAMQLNFQIAEKRLAENRWWYGDTWSAVDAYLNWVWFRVEGTAFDCSAYPALARHALEMNELPHVRRTLEKQQAASKQLEAEGLAISFDGPRAIEMDEA